MSISSQLAAWLGYQRIPPNQSRPRKVRDLAELRQTMVELQVLDAVLPAAKAAAQLRACGVRLVGSPEAIQVLEQMAAEGNEAAEWVAGNLFPQGCFEVTRGKNNRWPVVREFLSCSANCAQLQRNLTSRENNHI